MEAKRTCDTCNACATCLKYIAGRAACTQYERMPSCDGCRRREFCPDAPAGTWCPNYQEEPR